MKAGAKSKQVKLSFDKFRISRSEDKRNWILQELIKGGINPKTKEQAEPRWVDRGYFGKLTHLITALLDDHFEIQTDTLEVQLKAILEEIKKAEARLLEQMKVIS